MPVDQHHRHSNWARGEWHEAARVLRRSNPEWSNKRIAEALGVTNSAVWKVLNPERTSTIRARDNANRHTSKLAWQWQKDHSEEGRTRCEGCGHLKGAGSLRHSRKWEDTRYCQACRGVIAEVRRTLTEGMWAAGWTYREMGEAFGVDKHRMGIDVAKWRANGHADAFPHRRTPEQVERIREGYARGRRRADERMAA